MKEVCLFVYFVIGMRYDSEYSVLTLTFNVYNHSNLFIKIKDANPAYLY